MSGFLLCDPALVMPPPDNEEDEMRFWMRLVEWAADHRVRLGPSSHDLVISLLGTVGWPQFDSHRYPPGMARLAYRALSTLLGQAFPPEETLPTPPKLKPGYLPHAAGARTIGSDAAKLHHDEGLIGVATDPTHWEESCEKVGFSPPPPSYLSLLFEPLGLLPQEEDRAVAEHLQHRRVTIIGGIQSDQLFKELQARFEPKEIRWFGSEPGSRLNLDGLEGLQARVDVVYCITSHIGHDGSIKARKCCRKRGVELRTVVNPKEIATDLCRRHGCS